MSRRDLSRREFLKQSGGLALLGLGASFLQACGGKAEPCSDLSGLSEADKQTRVTFAYRAETLIPAKRCDNCNFWQPPAAGQDCGGCTLVKGPITAAGYCNSWVEPVDQG
jgi:hypothetical protein